MPTLLDYRRRIRSVKSTQQITRAMKFVAAAKLRRAQEGVFAARPYAREILRVLRSAAARMDTTAHPLLERRPEEQVLVVVLTGDRSLCGAFNTNVLRRAMSFIREIRGRKKRTDGRRQERPRHACASAAFISLAEYLGVSSRVDFSIAKEIAARIAELYAKNEVDAVYAIYNEFKNVMVQNLRAEKLLPIDPAILARRIGARAATATAIRCRRICRASGKSHARRLHLRRAGRRNFQRPGAAVSGIGGFPDFARIGRSRARRAHDGDGFGHAERVGTDRQADAGDEQDSPGGDHQGIDRNRQRRGIGSIVTRDW